MKRTRIIVETERLLSLSRRGRAVDCWCERCGGSVQMICAQRAATLIDIGLREICRRVEAGRLHFKETSEGELLICLNSLFQ
jgi:hypothetical protein